MRRLFLASVLLSSTLAVGCSDKSKARIDVAKNNVLEQIDQMLGKIEVQKAEIDNGIQSAKQGIDGIRTAKIKAQVQLEQLTEKGKPFEEKIAQCDTTLGRMKELLGSDKPAEIAGKTYTQDELKEMANKVIAARKDAETQLNGFKSAKESIAKLVGSLAKTQETIEARVANLQSQVAKLDAEMVAAKAMKQAAAAMGEQGGTLASGLDELEKKIATMSGDVKAQLQTNSETFAASSVDTKAVNDVDAFIKAAQTPTDTLGEIDKILNKKK